MQVTENFLKRRKSYASYRCNGRIRNKQKLIEEKIDLKITYILSRVYLQKKLFNFFFKKRDVKFKKINCDYYTGKTSMWLNL